MKTSTILNTIFYGIIKSVFPITRTIHLTVIQTVVNTPLAGF
jgi:hypothetical protein